MREGIAKTVEALQSEVDDSKRRRSGRNLATERSEVKIDVITAFLLIEKIPVVFVREEKAQ